MTFELNRRYVRILSLVVLGVLMAGTVTACGGDGDGNGTAGTQPSGDANGDTAPAVVRVAHNGNAANLALRVAAEQGFLEEHGINAEFEIIDNIGTIPPVLGRDFDIGMVAPTALLAASAQGLDLVWVAGLTIATEEEPVGELIAAPGSGVDSIEDVEGKTLGVLTEQGTLHIATRAWFADVGVDRSTVNVVQVDGPSHREQLEAGRVDVIETVDPFRENVHTIEGAVSIGFPFLELAPEGIRPLAYVATSTWAEENPDVVEGLRSAIDDAIAWMADNEDAARTILQDYSGLPEQVVQTAPLPTYVSDPSVEDLETWNRVMTELGILDAELDVPSLVFDPAG